MKTLCVDHCTICQRSYIKHTVWHDADVLVCCSSSVCKDALWSWAQPSSPASVPWWDFTFLLWLGVTSCPGQEKGFSPVLLHWSTVTFPGTREIWGFSSVLMSMCLCRLSVAGPGLSKHFSTEQPLWCFFTPYGTELSVPHAFWWGRQAPTEVSSFSLSELRLSSAFNIWK